MNCFKLKKSKTPSQTEQTQVIPENRIVMHEVLLKIKDCKVHLMDEEDALELANGDFEVFRVSDSNISLATTIKVGDELQWPLTKDEPVVKLDALHYLFSLPMKDGKALSYGVTFSQKQHGDLSLLDAFLKENSLFTSAASSSSRKEVVDWKDFAPVVDEYNSVLARAIAGGTGQIVKGIFKCSNAYSNQVQMGGETILIRAVEDKKRLPSNEIRKSNSNVAKKKSSAVNQSLKRVRKLSKMTEKLSKTMLDAVGVASGSMIVPVVRSGPGKNFLSMVPGEVVLASLDAVNKIIDASEAAEKQAMAATSGAVTRMVTERWGDFCFYMRWNQRDFNGEKAAEAEAGLGSDILSDTSHLARHVSITSRFCISVPRFGESAGEATEDALATAGHCAGTAWNVIKIRKAINPASAAVPSGLIKRKP